MKRKKSGTIAAFFWVNKPGGGFTANFSVGEQETYLPLLGWMVTLSTVQVRYPYLGPMSTHHFLDDLLSDL